MFISTQTTQSSIPPVADSNATNLQKMINLTDDIITTLIKSDEPSSFTLINWTRNKDAIGGNFCSDVSRILVKYQKGKNHVEKSYILKIAHASPLHKYHTRYNIEQREFLMYTNIIPMIRETDDDAFAPKFYYSDENYSLILEDLTSSGYKLSDRIEKLDFQHCQLVFKTLAKLHAYSVKFHATSQIPGIFNKNTFFLSDDAAFSHLNPVFAKAYDCFLCTFDQTLVQKYRKQLASLRADMMQRICSEVRGTDDTFKVLNHGDIWSNNIMFKYDKYDSVQRVKFIDFQLCRWASPAFDIIHFTTTSMKFQVFEKYFDLLLEIYLETLNNTLRYFNCPTYTIDNLKKDVDNKFAFAVLGFTVLTPVIMAESSDPVALSSILQDPAAHNRALEKAYRRPCYQDFARQWFLYFVNTGKLAD